MISEDQAIQALKALIPEIGMYSYNEMACPSRSNRIINWQYLSGKKKKQAVKIMKSLNIEYYINARFGLSVDRDAVIRKRMFKAERELFYKNNPRANQILKQIILTHKRASLRRASREVLYHLDPNAPDTLGWKAFEWNDEKKCLESPYQTTEWPSDGMLEDIGIEISDMVENQRGIHAVLMPIDWKRDKHPYGTYYDKEIVLAIVERWGKAVVGTMGWRAERVIIKEVLAPSTEIGLEIEKAYPSIIVHYDFVPRRGM